MKTHFILIPKRKKQRCTEKRNSLYAHDMLKRREKKWGGSCLFFFFEFRTLLSLGPGARWLNRFCDSGHQSDGRGRAAVGGLRFRCGEASPLTPATPPQQDGHMRGSLPLISHCYVGQETHLHFALLASPRVLWRLWKHEEGYGGGSVRDSSKMGPI